MDFSHIKKEHIHLLAANVCALKCLIIKGTNYF